LSKDDFSETLKGFQFVIEKDPQLKGICWWKFLCPSK
jgi:hypothetical protein